MVILYIRNRGYHSQVLVISQPSKQNHKCVSRMTNTVCNSLQSGWFPQCLQDVLVSQTLGHLSQSLSSLQLV